MACPNDVAIGMSKMAYFLKMSWIAAILVETSGIAKNKQI